MRKPDPREPGPAIDFQRALSVRRAINRNRILVRRGAVSELIELEPNPYAQLCRLLDDPAPDGRYIYWEGDSGVQVFYASRDERHDATTGSVRLGGHMNGFWVPGTAIFVARIIEGDLIGLDETEIGMLEAGLRYGSDSGTGILWQAAAHAAKDAPLLDTEPEPPEDSEARREFGPSLDDFVRDYARQHGGAVAGDLQSLGLMMIQHPDSTMDYMGWLIRHPDALHAYARSQGASLDLIEPSFVHPRCVEESTPSTPRCVGCGLAPEETGEYPASTKSRDAITNARYIQANEGTFNSNNGHFRCTLCYVRAGQPKGKAP